MLSPTCRIGASASRVVVFARGWAGAAAPRVVASESAAALTPALAKNLRRLVRISISPSGPGAPARRASGGSTCAGGERPDPTTSVCDQEFQQPGRGSSPVARRTNPARTGTNPAVYGWTTPRMRPSRGADTTHAPLPRCAVSGDRYV